MKWRLSRRCLLLETTIETKDIGVRRKKRAYSVKTGYWNTFAAHHKINQHKEAECSNPAETLWNTIWNLDIPPKERIFTWKVAHDIVATEANLTLHRVPTNPRCTLCGFH